MLPTEYVAFMLRPSPPAPSSIALLNLLLSHILFTSTPSNHSCEFTSHAFPLQMRTRTMTWCCTGRKATNPWTLTTEYPCRSSSSRSFTPLPSWLSTAAQVLWSTTHTFNIFRVQDSVMYCNIMWDVLCECLTQFNRGLAGPALECRCGTV